LAFRWFESGLRKLEEAAQASNARFAVTVTEATLDSKLLFTLSLREKDKDP